MKKIFLFIVFLFLPFTFAQALELPSTYSSKVYIYDITDDTELFNKDGDTRTSIASLTKLMTVYTAIDHTNDLDQSVTLTTQMLGSIPSDLYVVGLKVGETYTLRELCYAAIISSGADATYAIAYTIGGDTSTFVQMMNEEAVKIGMSNTHYDNFHGLDSSGQYSTASDINKFLLFALKNDEFKDIYYKQKYELNSDKTLKRWYNSKLKSNGINTKNLLGGKTGLTNGAGVCFAGVYKSDNHEFIIIVLNAPNVYNESYHIDDMITLMKFIDDNYNYYSIYKKGDVIGSVEIFLGKDGLYKVKAPEDVKVFLPSDYDITKASFTTTFINSIMYGSLKGKYIGHVIYYYDGEEVDETDLYLDKNVKGDWAKIIDYYTNDIVLGVSIVVLIILIFVIRLLKPEKKRKK